MLVIILVTNHFDFAYCSTISHINSDRCIVSFHQYVARFRRFTHIDVHIRILLSTASVFLHSSSFCSHLGKLTTFHTATIKPKRLVPLYSHSTTTNSEMQ